MVCPVWCASVPPELLRIENLRTVFRVSDGGVVKAVDGVYDAYRVTSTVRS